MNTGPVIYRYAYALLRFIKETGAGEKVYSQACTLVHGMSEVRQLAEAVMKHPELSLERKTELLASALGEDMSVELKRFTSLVFRNNRMELYGRMLNSFIEQYRQANSIKVGLLVTARPVPGLKERLQDVLGKKTGSEVFLEEKTDPSVLGGFVLDVDDLRLDASVSGQFRKLRRELIENNNRIV